ncbi:MAG: hypothetical protein RLZ77_1022 [Bacteroidota bacterium]|jgi:hypothetical protein
MNYEQLFQDFKSSRLLGRYITLAHLAEFFADLPSDALHVLGYSVQNQPIYAVQLGEGKTKVLMWSQMHGNESTTTKALIDFISFLRADTTESKALLTQFQFLFLPILNPDGAKAYTRENANGIDLNRDAQNRTQPESVVLKQAFDSFQPDYCYNLHDQRTIFGVGYTGLPATVSFLAPAFDSLCTYNAVRMQAVRVINAMHNALQQYIPNRMGRFDDTFNINCVGDTFQAAGVPTILIEAGHFPSDYLREKTRKFVFIGLISGLRSIYENDLVRNDIEDYMNIPQNFPNFYDFVYKNVTICCDGSKKIINFAAQYTEVLQEGDVVFKATISKIDQLDSFVGHHTYDCNNLVFNANGILCPTLGLEANFSLEGGPQFENGLQV